MNSVILVAGGVTFGYIDNKNKDGIFAPLKNIEYFKDFRLNANTIRMEKWC